MDQSSTDSSPRGASSSGCAGHQRPRPRRRSSPASRPTTATRPRPIPSVASSAASRCAGTGSRSSPAIPDVTRDVLRCAVDGDTVWTEWEHRGTRRDGSPHLMRGVIIFGVADGAIALGPLLPRAGRRRGRRRQRGRAPPGRAGEQSMILVAGGTGRLGTLVVDRSCSARARGARAHPRTRARRALSATASRVVVGDVRDPAQPRARGRWRRCRRLGGARIRRPGRRHAGGVDRDGNANLIDAAEAVGADLVLLSDGRCRRRTARWSSSG